ncbi:DNA polymerase III subunit delta' [Georgenia sp. 311]|uniref:DNA polymerase III subunit delta n=1 Tax=Georgenia wutianyii TaxID=2585135 RepID=A0ABX5VM68_9MICO|nr:MULTISPECIES: DNA polymerase III subunit delta' [Georgenia]QDB78119.1 DNA polymerase III subunit delta' [Georgenia wutianyii]TNC17565.1 DNA polymerase III subunit delta' [Georgenia sp. 311]
MSVWDDVVGQPEAVAVLRSAAEAARDIATGGDARGTGMTHAWLITGPPGSGRSVAARAFAAALACTSPDEVGCGRCHGCTTTLLGTHADVQLIATERVSFRIEDMRPIVSDAQQAPSQGRWRVMLMEDADRMVDRTSNVLLKAIEEPPPRTVWLLCAPSPRDLIATIRSRCRVVSLRVPAAEDVAALLVRRDGIDPAVAITAARAAQSHVGVARRLATDPDARARRRSILTVPSRIRGVGDAVLAAADLVELAQAEGKAATEERDAAERAELLRTLGAEGETRLPPAVRSQVKRLEDNQKSRATRAQRDVLDRAMVDILSLYRDVVVVQLGADVPLVNVDLENEVRALAADSTPEQTLRRMDAVATARTRLAANVAPLLAVEAMMVGLRPQAGGARL